MTQRSPTPSSTQTVRAENEDGGKKQKATKMTATVSIAVNHICPSCRNLCTAFFSSGEYMTSHVLAPDGRRVCWQAEVANA